MYIEAVPNRNSPPAILLRESYREKGRVKKRTLCNLTSWPSHLIEGLRALLKGGNVLPPGSEALTIRRSLPHGHVAAVLGTVRTIGLDRLLGPEGNRCRDLVLAMVVARLLAPASKLATAKALDPATAAHSLGVVLGLGAVDEDELYTALDWLAERQPAIEAALAKRHLEDGTLVLYDVSSSYLEGRCCELASFGHNRDGKKGKLQIVYGLLCAADGCPERRHQPLRGATKIALKVGAALDQHKMAKHFDLAITDDRFTVARQTEAIAAEAALDGIYVVRTSLPAATLDDAGTVAAYKSLALVERAFRSLKTVDLQIRPLYHWLGSRVRAHVFLCMLSYHVEWHLRARLAPMLYDDDDRDAAAAERISIVAKAARSPAAQAKQTLGLTDDGLAVHSYHSLLADLATLTRN